MCSASALTEEDGEEKQKQRGGERKTKDGRTEGTKPTEKVIVDLPDLKVFNFLRGIVWQTVKKYYCLFVCFITNSQENKCRNKFYKIYYETMT